MSLTYKYKRLPVEKLTIVSGYSTALFKSDLYTVELKETKIIQDNWNELPEIVFAIQLQSIDDSADICIDATDIPFHRCHIESIAKMAVSRKGTTVIITNDELFPLSAKIEIAKGNLLPENFIHYVDDLLPGEIVGDEWDSHLQICKLSVENTPRGKHVIYDTFPDNFYYSTLKMLLEIDKILNHS